ncbi:MAG: phosphatase PAP2 family protein [Bradyrhizobium sp.]|uniref:phosphatase PAP2 family protein n=1 Tax=Bradyrhizobium sp. TaxID=376 RepID=UPI0029B18C83|nr:phosphatase PAP2 family protein [Bradyrhizobium sp.]MDX3971757.1 phosphatase PAP2 family protein [Bradyrhizobium sp.]
MPLPDLANGVRDFTAPRQPQTQDCDVELPASGRSERAIWFIVAAGLVGLLFACNLLSFGIALGSGLLAITSNAVLLASAWLIERQGWLRISGWLTATAQIGFVTILLTALSYVLASTNLPMRDATLISLDQAVGIDWRSLVKSMMDQQRLMFVLNVAYASLHYQCPLLMLLLFLFGHHEKGMQFTLVWSITLAATVLIFPFAPALGGYLYYQLDPKDFPEVRIVAAWLFAPPLLAVRDGSLNVIELTTLDGIITFPSFHAAAAILLGWHWISIPLLRWPTIPLNALMLVSTVPVGGHYIVDVIAGSLLSVVAIIAVRAWDSMGQRNPRSATAHERRCATSSPASRSRLS